MQNLENVLDKLKAFRTDLTDGALVVDHEVDLEELIKIKDIEDELYETLLLIFTRNKNKMVSIKNEHTKNTLAIIDLTISIIEIISHSQHNNNSAPVNNNNNSNTNSTSTSSFSLTALLKPDNIFKVALSIIFILLTVWSMFIINPKATDDTMKSVTNIVEKTKKE